MVLGGRVEDEPPALVVVELAEGGADDLVDVDVAAQGLEVTAEAIKLKSALAFCPLTLPLPLNRIRIERKLTGCCCDPLPMNGKSFQDIFVATLQCTLGRV